MENELFDDNANVKYTRLLVAAKNGARAVLDVSDFLYDHCNSFTGGIKEGLRDARARGWDNQTKESTADDGLFRKWLRFGAIHAYIKKTGCAPFKKMAQFMKIAPLFQWSQANGVCIKKTYTISGDEYPVSANDMDTILAFPRNRTARELSQFIKDTVNPPVKPDTRMEQYLSACVENDDRPSQEGFRTFCGQENVATPAVKALDETAVQSAKQSAKQGAKQSAK